MAQGPFYKELSFDISLNSRIRNSPTIMPETKVKLPIPIFDGTGDFNAWKQRIQDLLTAEGFHEFPTSSDDCDETTKLISLSLVRLHLSQNVIDRLGPGVEKIPEIFKQLENIYLPAKLVNQHEIRKKIVNLKLQHPEEFPKHAATFLELTEQMDWDETEKLSFLLISLPPKFSRIVGPLEKTIELWTVKEAVNKISLFAGANKRTILAPVPVVVPRPVQNQTQNVPQGKQKVVVKTENSPPQDYRNFSYDQPTGRKKRRIPMNDFQGRVKCSFCHKWNHHISQCWHYKGDDWY